MKLIRFPNDDNEVLIDPEKVSRIERGIAAKNYIEKYAGKVMVTILFGVNERLEFFGKDAENVWDYFVRYVQN